METTTETPAQIFRRVVKGKNFITPELLGYYLINNGAAELTTSASRFMGKATYGVTIVQGGKKADDLCTCFSDTDRNVAKQKALKYIDSLK